VGAGVGIGVGTGTGGGDGVGVGAGDGYGPGVGGDCARWTEAGSPCTCADAPKAIEEESTTKLAAIRFDRNRAARFSTCTIIHPPLTLRRDEMHDMYLEGLRCRATRARA
jgi:hypothetical protein